MFLKVIKILNFFWLFWSAEIKYMYSENNRCLHQSDRHAVFQTIFYINRVIEVL